MSLFTDKLESLPQTVALLSTFDASPLSNALSAGQGRPTIAIGSGGSAVAASYFARCRETVCDQPTIVQTPMEFVLGSRNLRDTDVWLFSAGADNPDIAAAVGAAGSRRAAAVHLVTRSPEGNACPIVLSMEDGGLHMVPVAQSKDGFLATHSLVGTVGALLLAFGEFGQGSSGQELLELYDARVLEVLDSERIRVAQRQFESLANSDTLVILTDPAVESLALLIETSAWEAALCPVQRADIRNFAHGRHTWVQRYGSRTILLALTGAESSAAWSRIADLLPANQRQVRLNFGDCGRFQNAVAIVQGLVIVAAIGHALRIDPAKPGVGPFARDIYRSPELDHLSTALSAPVRQKRSALLCQDAPAYRDASVVEAGLAWFAQLTRTTVRGLVLDYDGTMVATEKRFKPPSPQLIDELARLIEADVQVAIATGRGGSSGEALRDVMPGPLLPTVVMGYYNGGYIRTLDVDIRDDPAPANLSVSRAFEWLKANSELFHQFEAKISGIQILVPKRSLACPETFAAELDRCPPIASGEIRATQSGHSVDLIPAFVTKTAVVDELARRIGGSAPGILRVGDSGAWQGNDFDLLDHPLGISVGEVSGRLDGCWSVFGNQLTGPTALVKLLQALLPDDHGGLRLERRLLARYWDGRRVT